VKNIAQYLTKYLTDQYSIKKYNDDYYKLTYSKVPVLNPGFVMEPRLKQDRNINDQKLDNHISRAKSKIFEYASCNDFDYFITLTLDKDKYDRHDLAKYIKDLGQFIRNQTKKFGTKMEYLLIPEPHKDKAWHMHGLIKGISQDQLKLFTLDDVIPYNLLNLIKQGHEIYNWTGYANKFGWCTLEKVKSREAIAKYVTKYISKSLSVDLEREKEKKLYYVSRGLKVSQKVKQGTLNHELRIPFSYENDYVKIMDLNGLQYLKLIHQLDQLEL
jgi:hypothetical protein